MNKRKAAVVILKNENKVEKYLLHFISTLAKVVDEIVVGCHAGLGDVERLQEVAARIELIPADKELSYACILRQLQMERYSTAILCDDSAFGPVYDLGSIMAKMEEKEADFWGMLKHAPCKKETGETSPEYLDPSFVVLSDRIFKWDQFAVLLEQEEKAWSVFLEGAGFQGAAWASTEMYDFPAGQNDIDYMYYYSYELIKEQRYPFLRIADFGFSSGLDYGHRDSLRKAFRYIEENLSYDMDLIWEYILAYYNVEDIQESLQLFFLLEKKNARCETPQYKAAVFMHLFYGDLLDETLEYVKNIPESIDIYITTCGEEQIAYVEDRIKALGRGQYQILEAGKRGRDAAALLVVCRKYIARYDVICFVHDKKTSGGKGPRMIGDAFRHLVFDNTIPSRGYIYNVLDLFADNPRLGFLTPPCPVLRGYQSYSGGLGNEWTYCYEAAVQLAGKLGLDLNISKDKNPIAMSNAFWCRVEALSAIFHQEWQMEDFPPEPLAEDGTVNHAIERIYPYIAQSAGYYTGILLEKDYTGNYLGNLLFSIRSMLQVIREKLSFSLSDDVLEALSLIGDNYSLYEQEPAILQRLQKEDEKKEEYIESLKLEIEAKKREVEKETGIKRLYMEENTKKEKYIEELKQEIAMYVSKVGDGSNLVEVERFRQERCKNSVLQMCRKNAGKRLLIYGAGKLAEKTAVLLDELEIEYESVVVSRMTEGQMEFRGHLVINMDLLKTYPHDLMILVALNSKNCAEVLPVLDEMGYTYFCPWKDE